MGALYCSAYSYDSPDVVFNVSAPLAGKIQSLMSVSDLQHRSDYVQSPWPCSYNLVDVGPYIPIYTHKYHLACKDSHPVDGASRFIGLPDISTFIVWFCCSPTFSSCVC